MQVILTHENADFDAIASLLGAHKLYPNASPVLPRRINRNVQAFLTLYGADFPFVNPETLPRGQHIRRVILVDTQGLTYVRGMGPDLTDEVLVIDHHARPDELSEGWRFQGEMLGATTTLLVEALSTRLVPISRVEATLLLAGIYEDTGALTYTSTTARDLRAAAWLVDQGGSVEIVAEFLEHPLTPSQQDIYDGLKEHAETLDLNGHAVVLSWAVSPPHTEEEVSTLAHKLGELLDPSALFILVEFNENTQLVARSSTDDINVADVAQHFGGGGHDRAAAALIRHHGARETFAELCDLLPDFVRPHVTVRDMMSRGVRTLQPEETIEQVARKMLRTGHEGFPVVNDEEQVVGLVTRNAVDRAMQHNWSRQPVHRIMQEGEVTVSPKDSAERVRTRMIQSGWGQIPVVEDGRVRGVVTRTDLIRLPLSKQTADRQRIAHMMEEAFPTPLLALIRQIGARAAEEGHVIYFVGGIVRDLLLDHPIVDVDLVVEGDAIALGRALARAYGGEVRTHSRFGTVKWLLPEDIWEQVAPSTAPAAPGEAGSRNLPEFVDLVTARTEFYEKPTALPLVEESSIKQDLHRRDFTINTLAIRLDPQRWGQMLDFYGGQEDIEERVIRVLHSLSFVDDPTRILRAARFEARLGFRLDPRSEALIAEALPMLSRVTGGRIRNELDLIVHEERPEDALERLQELGALQEIDPALRSDAWLREHFERLREAPLHLWGMDAPETLHQLYWILFLYRLTDPALERVANRLLMPRRYTDPLRYREALEETQPALLAAEEPSEIVDLLDPLPLPLLAAAWVTADDPRMRERLERYAREWQHVSHVLDGEDLKRLGIPPGPIYRKIFAELRAARLDGEITSREEEIERVRRIRDQASSPTEG